MEKSVSPSWMAYSIGPSGVGGWGWDRRLGGRRRRRGRRLGHGRGRRRHDHRARRHGGSAGGGRDGHTPAGGRGRRIRRGGGLVTAGERHDQHDDQGDDQDRQNQQGDEQPILPQAPHGRSLLTRGYRFLAAPGSPPVGGFAPRNLPNVRVRRARTAPQDVAVVYTHTRRRPPGNPAAPAQPARKTTGSEVVVLPARSVATATTSCSPGSLVQVTW